MKFSEKMSCPNDHTIDTDDLEPRSFSFNSPFGACTVCSRLGTKMEVDPELVVPDTGATLGEGAIAPWSGAHVADYFLRLINALGEELGFDLNTPWDELPAEAPAGRCSTATTTKVHVRHRNRYGRERAYYADFEGVRPYIERRPPGGRVRHQPRALRGLHARGARARPATARGSSRSSLTRCTDRAARHRRGLRAADRRVPPSSSPTLELSAREQQIAERVLKEIQARLRLPARRRPRLPLARPARPARCPAARRSASGWPPRSAPAWSACSTSSTSRRSACTSATTAG